MRAHEAGGVVFGVLLRTLYGEVDLVLAETFVDGVDGMHEAFQAVGVVGRLRRKEVQLHAGVAL